MSKLELELEGYIQKVLTDIFHRDHKRRENRSITAQERYAASERRLCLRFVFQK